MGFQYGTPEHSQCTMQLLAQREAANDANRAQMFQLGVQLLTEVAQLVETDFRLS